jgi:hypothetical protein
MDDRCSRAARPGETDGDRALGPGKNPTGGRRSIERIGAARVVATAIAALAVMCVSQVAAVAEDPRTNQAVIVKTIKSSPTAFETSVASLEALTEAGVSDAVIAEMMSAGEAQPAAAAPAPARTTRRSSRGSSRPPTT